MKSFLLILLLVLAPVAARAQAAFPGLQQVLTEAEWKRAGLDKLTPDEVGVIDAALIKHFARAPMPSTGSTAASAAAPATASAQPAAPATPAEAAAARSRFWDKFGLSRSANEPDWRTQPPMTAKVTAWRGANGFVLDNGQVWEGLEKIPFDLPGNTVTIEARPRGAYALKLNEDSVAVRVQRVR